MACGLCFTGGGAAALDVKALEAQLAAPLAVAPEQPPQPAHELVEAHRHRRSHRRAGASGGGAAPAATAARRRRAAPPLATAALAAGSNFTCGEVFGFGFGLGWRR